MTTIFFRNIILNAILNNRTDVIPKEYYIGLSMSAPSEDGSCVGELSSAETGYKRVKIHGFQDALGGVVRNSVPINFPPSLISWDAPQYYAVFDAEEQGNLLFYGRIEATRTIEPNSVLTIEPGILTVDIVNTEHIEESEM